MKKSINMRLDEAVLAAIPGPRTQFVEAAINAALGKCPTCGSQISAVGQKEKKLKALGKIDGVSRGGEHETNEG